MTRPEFVALPDYAIIGFTMPDGSAAVIGSADLNDSQLYEVISDAQFLSVPFVPSNRRVVVQTAIGAYTYGYGKDHPAALLALFEQWSPSENPRDVLNAIRADGPVQINISGDNHGAITLGGD